MYDPLRGTREITVLRIIFGRKRFSLNLVSVDAVPGVQNALKYVRFRPCRVLTALLQDPAGVKLAFPREGDGHTKIYGCLE